MHRVLAILGSIFLLSSGAQAQRLVSGEEMVLPCTRVLLGGGDESLNHTQQMAFCVGAVSAIAWTAPHLETGSQFCIPTYATRGEQVAAVVRYMRNHTDRLREDFFLLAFQALRQTWPCPGP
jgi:hypothetical protein